MLIELDEVCLVVTIPYEIVTICELAHPNPRIYGVYLTQRLATKHSWWLIIHTYVHILTILVSFKMSQQLFCLVNSLENTANSALLSSFSQHSHDILNPRSSGLTQIINHHRAIAQNPPYEESKAPSSTE